MIGLNKAIAETFQQYASLLEIQGESPFRVRAYRNASDTMRNLTWDVKELIQQNKDLTELPAIGKDIAKKIEEFVKTGHLKDLDHVKKVFPESLLELLEIQGLGPKGVRKIYDTLHVSNLNQLQELAQKGGLSKVPGFGQKTQLKLMEEINRKVESGKRYLLPAMEAKVEELVKFIQLIPGVKKVTAAGSFRRRKATIGDLDLVVSCKRDSRVMDYFVKHGQVSEVLSKGPTRSAVRLNNGFQVDVRVVPESSYGAALLYFTGSKSHNIALRRIAQSQGKKINEYGLYQETKKLAGFTEKDIYKNLGLSFIEPELRENQGEIQAAQKGELPQLIQIKDIKGNLHAHTDASDGRHSLEDVAQMAKEAGFEYFAITDHSKSLTVANGLDEKRLLQQMEAIDRLNETLDGIKILKGIEVDILEDGQLDLADDILKKLDVCVASIHSHFNLDEEQQTERLVRAMDNPYVHIIGHPTGRLLQKRESYSINIERLMDAAHDRNCYLELNTQIKRLDLSDQHCRLAKEKGVKIAISTDAHRKDDFSSLRYGIDQARRAWLNPTDVINTRPWPELQKLLKRSDSF
ncbi:MAG: DNA polymerase/3'-5' exonuclease PolX [Oligoflexus sp.]